MLWKNETVVVALMDQQILTTRLVNLLLFCIIVVLVHSASCGSEGAFETASIDSLVVRSKELIPEGIAVNKNTGEIYLSSLHQNKIVVVDNNGVCKDLIACCRQKKLLKF